jgi:glycosyltransferase involved in cell wall biosynthesis
MTRDPRSLEGAMRVVDVINLSSSAHTLLERRVRAMREAGVDNRIVCGAGPYVPVLEAAGIPVHVVDMPRGVDPARLLATLTSLSAYLRRESIDVVHTHCSVPGAIGRVAAWLAGVPVIIHTVHGFHFHERSSWPVRTAAVAVERFCGALTDTLLTQNRTDLEQANRYGIGPRERRRRIGNGIDVGRFRPVLRPPRPGPTMLISVARLEAVKNHDLLFDALRRLIDQGEDVRLRLVGEGPLRPACEARCHALGIADRVEFLGYRDDVPALLADSDIAVLTSIKEGIPRAVLEAMAMGLPVVATNVVGTREAVRHEDTGFLVELGDVAGLAAAIARLAHDPALRARLGARGRAVAVAEFDEGPIVETLREIYAARLRASRPAPALLLAKGERHGHGV